MSAALVSPANDADRAFFDRELESFLPDRVFDAHTHLLKEGTNPWTFKGIPLNLGYEETQFFIQDLHPRRRNAGLFLPGFGVDFQDKLPEANAWMGAQTAKA